MTTRRIVLKSLAAGALAASSLKALAADKWPQRPVKIAVPFAAGGNTDGIARLIGQYLTEKLGETFIVENRVGGRRHHCSRGHRACGARWLQPDDGRAAADRHPADNAEDQLQPR